MFKTHLITIVAILFLFTGCASMISGTTQKIKIDSDPQGATVVVGKMKKKSGKKILVDPKEIGITPIEVDVHRKKGMVTLSKEGFESQEVFLNRGSNPWIWGDILLTSPLSTSIDTSTGACYEYKPGQYMITLTPDP